MNELVDADIFERSFHMLQTRIGQKSKHVEIQKGFDAVKCPGEGSFPLFL